MSSQPSPELDDPMGDPVLLAAVEMIGRTGAKHVQIRFSDEEEPTVWMAVSQHQTDHGLHSEVAAALHPRRAFLRLLEQLVDGGRCTHCKRPTGFDPDSFDEMPFDKLICWYQYDPELQKFRRACE